MTNRFCPEGKQISCLKDTPHTNTETTLGKKSDNKDKTNYVTKTPQFISLLPNTPFEREKKETGEKNLEKYPAVLKTQSNANSGCPNNV